jgi:hypothetical protein
LEKVAALMPITTAASTAAIASTPITP